MKVLWFCNVMLPQIARHLSIEERLSYGWLAGLSDCLVENDEVDLAVAFPTYNERTVFSGKVGNLKYFGYPWKVNIGRKFIRDTEKSIEVIIKQTNPDIIHLHGTEDFDKLSVVNVCERLGVVKKIVVSIQGMSSVMPQHYYAGLPSNIINKYTFRHLIKQDNIRQQRYSQIKTGKSEIEVIKKVQHIIGRTDWDRACTFRINPHAQYHFCNETLRTEFYRHSWEIEKCERHSIFMSQAYYPVKGLHKVLEALPDIIKHYPDTHLFVAGHDITKTDTLMLKIKEGSYSKHIKKIIKMNDLQNYITFTGVLGERAMCERFLKSHVFVSASSVENESNSVSEAKILGVPVVASFVGGVTERLKHYETGFFYQFDAPYMLAYYVRKLFNDDNLALQVSRNAKTHAQQIHDRNKNAERMLEIYREIIEQAM